MLSQNVSESSAHAPWKYCLVLVGVTLGLVVLLVPHDATPNVTFSEMVEAARDDNIQCKKLAGNVFIGLQIGLFSSDNACNGIGN